MESSYSQRSPCWPDEQQLYCAQTCLRSPAELSLPLGNSLSHAALHANNNNNNNGSALHSRQRRTVRLKVKGKKSTLRMYARPEKWCSFRRQTPRCCDSSCWGFFCFHCSAGGKNSQNRKVTDYYPIRRSSRKSKTELKVREAEDNLHNSVFIRV